MRRSTQHALAGALLLLALAAAVMPAGGEEKKAAPKPDNYTEKLPGTDVTFDMVAVPGGEFVMGSPEDEKGREADEGPRHPVRIAAFWMGKCEVTWDEYDVYRKEVGLKNTDEYEEVKKKDPDAITGPTPPYVPETYGHGRERFPALCMTHHAATEYCTWLSKKTGKAYRLPTEAEWEYAARAGSKTAYSFGDDPKTLGDYAWYDANCEDHTHKVGLKKPNAWGLHDMHGNVMEWCVDAYRKDAYARYPLDKPTLGPVLLPGPERFRHVARGGCWSDEAPRLRSAARVGSDASWIQYDPQRPRSIWWLTNWDVVGFRVVRAVEEQADLKGLRSRVTRQSKMMPD